MAGDKIAGVFDLKIALDHRFDQVAPCAYNGDYGANAEPKDEAHIYMLHPLEGLDKIEYQQRYSHRKYQAAEETLPGLLRRHSLDEFVATYATPHQIGSRVVEPHQYEDGQEDKG